MKHYIITLPLRVLSEPNTRGHWSQRARRARAARTAMLAVPRLDAGWLPCIVTLTRIAPRALDDDNLRGALKAARDGVADRLAVDDRDPRVTWRYAQERAGVREYGVRVEVQA